MNFLFQWLFGRKEKPVALVETYRNANKALPPVEPTIAEQCSIPLIAPMLKELGEYQDVLAKHKPRSRPIPTDGPTRGMQ